jgi:hypothetical protein
MGNLDSSKSERYVSYKFRTVGSRETDGQIRQFTRIAPPRGSRRQPQRGAGRWLALAKCHRITPTAFAPSRQQSLRSATAHSPHKNQQSIAATFEKIPVEMRRDLVDAL